MWLLERLQKETSPEAQPQEIESSPIQNLTRQVAELTDQMEQLRSLLAAVQHNEHCLEQAHNNLAEIKALVSMYATHQFRS